MEKSALGQDLPCPPNQIACWQKLIQQPKTTDQLEPVLQQIKTLSREKPENRSWQLLLAKTYLTDNNHFWARNILNRYLELKPADCEVISWLAWISLAEGDLEGATDLLQRANCGFAKPGATKLTKQNQKLKALTVRLQLLRALLNYLRQKPAEAMNYLEESLLYNHIFHEDLLLRRYSGNLLQFKHFSPLSIRLDGTLGYTTNALGSFPADTAASEDSSASSLAQIFLWLQFIPFHYPLFDPVLEADMRAQWFSAQKASSINYLDLSARPGIIISNLGPRITINYNLQTLFLLMGDKYKKSKPILFFEAHRIELEFMGKGFSAFLAGGKRLFREMTRNRWEVESWLGNFFRAMSNLSLTTALALKFHQADNQAYNLYGLKGLASFKYQINRDLYSRIGSVLGWDYYPQSKEFFQPNKIRRDILLKLSSSLWYRLWRQWRLGITYEYSQRFSTALKYKFIDQRLLFKTFWQGNFDPWEPQAISVKNHVEMDYGLKEELEQGDLQDRISDLLRQDEASRRGSSCLE